jgi:hypothetical protein
MLIKRVASTLTITTDLSVQNALHHAVLKCMDLLNIVFMYGNTMFNQLNLPCCIFSVCHLQCFEVQLRVCSSSECYVTNINSFSIAVTVHSAKHKKETFISRTSHVVVPQLC